MPTLSSIGKKKSNATGAYTDVGSLVIPRKESWVIYRTTKISMMIVVALTATGQTNFHKYNDGLAPVLEKSSDLTAWDVTVAADAEVVFYQDTFRLWYTSSGIPPQYQYPRIGYAWSEDGANWTKLESPVFEGTPGDWDSLAVETVSVLVDTTAPPAERFKMWYVGTNDPGQLLYHRMGYAYSPDGINWTKYPSNPVLRAETGPTGIDVIGFEGPSVVFDGSIYHMWYTCIPYFNNQEYWDGWINIAYASSIDGVNWIKKQDEPTFRISQHGWDSLFVQTPDVIKIGSIFHMFYSGTRSDSTDQTAGGGWHYRVGYAWAPENDIHNWNRYSEPVLMNGAPGRWDDASVGLVTVEYANNNLHLWYTGQDACINDTACVWPEIPYWDTGYAIDSMVTLGIRDPLFHPKDKVLVYPNPSNQQVVLRFDGHETKHTLVLYNLQGQRIMTISDIAGDQLIITKENVSSGLYFFQLRTGSQTCATGKLAIVK